MIVVFRGNGLFQVGALRSRCWCFCNRGDGAGFLLVGEGHKVRGAPERRLAPLVSWKLPFGAAGQLRRNWVLSGSTDFRHLIEKS